MTLRSAVAKAAIAGMVLPIAILLCCRLALLLFKTHLEVFEFIPHLELAVLIIWPSSIFLLIAPEAENAGIVILSVVLNTIFYALFGGLVWTGIYRQRIIIYILVPLVGLIIACTTAWSFGI